MYIPTIWDSNCFLIPDIEIRRYHHTLRNTYKDYTDINNTLGENINKKRDT